MHMFNDELDILREVLDSEEDPKKKVIMKWAVEAIEAQRHISGFDKRFHICATGVMKTYPQFLCSNNKCHETERDFNPIEKIKELEQTIQQLKEGRQDEERLF